MLSHFDDMPILMVEVDTPTANALAKQRDVECLSAEMYVQRVLQGSDVSQCVPVDSVVNPMVWIAAGLANVGRLLHALHGVVQDPTKACLVMMGWFSNRTWVLS